MRGVTGHDGQQWKLAVETMHLDYIQHGWISVVETYIWQSLNSASTFHYFFLFVTETSIKCAHKSQPIAF